MNYLVDKVEAERLKAGAGPLRMEPAPDSALAYLQSLYRDPSVDPVIRRRCAIACLPFESPKYEAVAIAHFEGGTGDRLDKAAKRLHGLPEARREGRLLEFVRGNEKGGEPAPPSTPLRRI